MERLTAEDYFRESFVILSEHGSDGLTIALLCDGLQVTKGSFYHHFGGLPGFVTALLAFWESEHSERLIAASRAQPDPGLRLFGLTEIAVSLPHATEAALRAWGRSNPEVAEATARVDKRRERHVTDAIVALGVERAPARLLARMAIAMLIGTQQREQPVDHKRMRQMLAEFNKLVYLDADPAVLARVRAAGG